MLLPANPGRNSKRGSSLSRRRRQRHLQPWPHAMTTLPTDSDGEIAKIPIEIITEEEMALIESAFAAAAAAVAMPIAHVCRNSNSIRSMTRVSKRGLSSCSAPDIEDSGRVVSPNRSTKNSAMESFLDRFRKGRPLSVTDLTSTEWCEKQMEYTLLFGKPKKTKAMQAGSTRHAVLEEEVIKRVKVSVESSEDVWALKFVNFVVGVNQLLIDGLTRELPLVGLVEGIWMVGILDEIRMPVSQSESFPLLVDTKTRQHATLPCESQKRNGRLQLMCYKYMWDSLVVEKFPHDKFFEFFSLNPNQILSQKIRELTSESGFPSETLSDVVRYFGNSCCLLPQASNRLLLRYEFQGDQSLIGEDEFDYEADWVKDQIKCGHEFWQGKREAEYPPVEERWKCRFCQFKSVCPATPSPAGSPTKTKMDGVR